MVWGKCDVPTVATSLHDPRTSKVVLADAGVGTRSIKMRANHEASREARRTGLGRRRFTVGFGPVMVDTGRE
jgi:hypothetical protein